MTDNKDQKQLTGDALVKSLLGKVDPRDYKRTATKMRVAGAIAEHMEEYKLSKTKLAEQLKTQPSVITKWLSGTHNFTIDTLSDISSCLNIPVSEFFTKHEEPVISSTSFVVTGFVAQDVRTMTTLSPIEGLGRPTLRAPFESAGVKSEWQNFISTEGITGIKKQDHYQFTVKSDKYVVAEKRTKLSERKALSKV